MKKKLYIIRWGRFDPDMAYSHDWYAYCAWGRGKLWAFQQHYIHAALSEFEAPEKLGYGGYENHKYDRA